LRMLRGLATTSRVGSIVFIGLHATLATANAAHATDTCFVMDCSLCIECFATKKRPPRPVGSLARRGAESTSSKPSG
jgi:hypothetical protein